MHVPPLQTLKPFTFRNSIQRSSSNYGLSWISLNVSQRPGSNTYIYRHNIMHVYCLKLSLFPNFLLHIDFMTLGLCFCSADIFIACCVPMEALGYLKISGYIFSLCARQLLLSAADCFWCVCKTVTALCCWLFLVCARPLLLSAADCFWCVCKKDTALCCWLLLVCARQLLLSAADCFWCVCKRVNAVCCWLLWCVCNRVSAVCCWLLLVCVQESYCSLLLTAFSVCARELLLCAAECFWCV